MAKPLTSYERARRLLLQLAGRKPPALPQPSHEERAREEERQKNNARLDPAEDRKTTVRTAFYTGQPLRRAVAPPGADKPGEYDRQNGKQAARIEREINARYKTERGRATARRAYDDAAGRSEAAEEAYRKAMEKQQQGLRDLHLSVRAPSAEAGLASNQWREDITAALYADRAEIKADLEAALEAADYDDHLLTALDQKLIESAIPADQKLIGYERDLTGQFGQAIGPDPSQPGPPPPPPDVIELPDETRDAPDLGTHFLIAAMEAAPEFVDDQADIYDRFLRPQEMRPTPPPPARSRDIGIDV